MPKLTKQQISDAAYLKKMKETHAAQDKRWGEFKAKQVASDAAYFKRKAAKGKK